jgi:hypothetical protein
VSSAPDPSESRDGTTRPFGQWLRDLIGRRPAPDGRRPAAAPPSAGDSAEHLRRAAECYARAGWDEDVCRVYGGLGDDRRAAPYLERLGRWAQAAGCYERVTQWNDAARCHVQAERFDDAADCLLKAGEALQAAWLLADRAHRYRRAEIEVGRAADRTDHDRLAKELILARCEAATGDEERAVGRLRDVTERLRTLPADAPRGTLLDWGLVVAERLRRPDLTALLFAAAVAAGLHKAEERWEAWALEVLGDATGVPLPPEGLEEAAETVDEAPPAAP